MDRLKWESTLQMSATLCERWQPPTLLHECVLMHPSACAHHSIYCRSCLHVCLQEGVWSARKCMHVTSCVGCRSACWDSSLCNNPVPRLHCPCMAYQSQGAASSQSAGTNNVSRREAPQQMSHSSQALLCNSLCMQASDVPWCKGHSAAWQHMKCCCLPECTVGSVLMRS